MNTDVHIPLSLLSPSLHLPLKQRCIGIYLVCALEVALFCYIYSYLYVAAIGNQRNTGELEKSLSDLLPVIDCGVKKVRSSQVFSLIALLLCCTALVFTNNLSIPFGLTVFVYIVRIVLVVYSAFCVWMAAVMSNLELSALLAARKDANVTLRILPAFQ